MTTTTSTTTSTVNAHELRRIREADPEVRIIDVRTPGEYETAHIQGSYNVPLDQLGEHASELAALDHPVVLVCQSGARATKAMDQLASAGKGNMRLLTGGIGAWQAAGCDVVEQSERWSLERQVRLVAGAIVLAAIIVSIWVPAARFVAGFVGAQASPSPRSPTPAPWRWCSPSSRTTAAPPATSTPSSASSPHPVA
jgi:rhodanese-related sulfurtransferase